MRDYKTQYIKFYLIKTYEFKESIIFNTFYHLLKCN